MTPAELIALAEQMTWLGKKLEDDAEAQGIKQGSEGARYCFCAAAALRQLAEQKPVALVDLTTSEPRLVQLCAILSE